MNIPIPDIKIINVHLPWWAWTIEFICIAYLISRIPWVLRSRCPL